MARQIVCEISGTGVKMTLPLTWQTLEIYHKIEGLQVRVGSLQNCKDRFCLIKVLWHRSFAIKIRHNVVTGDDNYSTRFGSSRKMSSCFN